MKKEVLYIMLLSAMITTNMFAQTSKDNFKSAKQQLENMLDGKDSLSYEKAIYLIEHAYNNDKATYQDFQQTISFYTEGIERIIEAQNIKPEYKPENFYEKVRQMPQQYQADFKKATANLGIFTFMTDTTFFRLRSNIVMYNVPYTYSTSDPMGTSDWHNTQVTNLLEYGSGNCFALSSLFKIFADRLNSDATLCTAPNHIYIRHLDEKGTRYNVDLTSGTFPGAGTLQTLTYTTKEAIKNDISLRKLTTEQAVTLCMVYLAKGYQYKFNLKDEFMLQCAETALKYDSLNLNAMLLKVEYLEHVVKQQNKTIAQLQTNKDFKEYEKLLAHLYEFGYREMPLDMKNILVHGWKKDTTMLYLQNYLIAKKDETRKMSLSHGLFDEEIADKPIEQYGQALFDTKTKKISSFVKEQPLYNDYNFDPVAFAMNVDPLAYKFPGQSPYIFAGDKPIAFVDEDGLQESLSIRLRQYETGFLKGQNSEKDLIQAQKGAGFGGVTGAAVVLSAWGLWEVAPNVIPMLTRATYLMVAHNEIGIGIAGLTCSIVDPNPGADYPGGFDDIARGTRLLVKNKNVERFILNTNKFNFFFGKSKGSPELSLQRAAGFAEMGIKDNKEGEKTFLKYMSKVVDKVADNTPKLNELSGKYEVYKTVEVVENGISKGSIKFGLGYSDEAMKSTPEIFTAIPQLPKK